MPEGPGVVMGGPDVVLRCPGVVLGSTLVGARSAWWVLRVPGVDIGGNGVDC